MTYHRQPGVQLVQVNDQGIWNKPVQFANGAPLRENESSTQPDEENRSRLSRGLMRFSSCVPFFSVKQTE